MDKELFIKEAEIVYRDLVSELTNDMCKIKSNLSDVECHISQFSHFSGVICSLDSIPSREMIPHAFKYNQTINIEAVVKHPLLEAGDNLLEGICPLKSKYYKRLYTSKEEESTTFVYFASYLDFPTVKRFDKYMEDILSIIPINPMEARNLVHQTIDELSELLLCDDRDIHLVPTGQHLTKRLRELQQTDLVLELVMKNELFHKWVAAPVALKNLEEKGMNLR